MAGFGADATGTYEANNFLTAKAKPVDESKGMLIKTLGDAAVGAAELYVKSKEVGFREEVQQTIDLAKAQDFIGPDENTDEIIAEVDAFRKQNKKAEQVFLTSGQTTKERVALQIEGRYRELVSKRPWLAKAYARASETVLTGNQATLSLLDTVQRAYLTDGNKSAEEERKGLVKRAEALQNSTGLDPSGFFNKPTVLSQATDEEILQYTAEASTLLSDSKKSQEAQQAATALAAQRTAWAAEVSAGAAVRREDQENNKRQAEAADMQQYNSIESMFSSSVNNRVRLFINRLNGNINPADWTSMQQEAMSFVAESAVSMDKAINSHPWVRREDKEALSATLNNRLNKLTELFTGDLNQAQTMARQFSATQSLFRVNAARVAPGIVALEAIAPNSGALMTANAIAERAGDPVLSQQIDNAASFRLPEEHNYGNLDNFKALMSGQPLVSFSAAELETLRRTSMKTQEDIADKSKPTGGSSDSPAVWGYTLDTVLTGGINPSDYGKVLSTSFNREFPERFKAFSSHDPERAQVLGAKAQREARNFAQAMRNRIANDPEVVDDIGAGPNGFTAENILKPRVQEYVNQLNNVLNILVATAPEGMGVSEADLKENLMRDAFGITLDEAPGGPN